jgi:hypothetical protein
MDPTPTDGDLVYGDSQADLDGLKGLLKKANWNPDKQRVWSIGDNIDRGPKAREMMQFMDYYGINSILGNHDWKMARYVHHHLNQGVTGKANPIKPNPEMQDTIDQFGPDLIKYGTKMKDYPLYLPFEDSQGKGYLMHGGPHPTAPIEHQDPNMMLVRRQHPHPPQFMRGESEEYPAWQRSYKGHLGTILHGHNGTPTADFWGNPHVVSLDGSGSIGKYANEKQSIEGQGWHGHHRLIRLGDRKIFESPGSPESEAHYGNLIASGAYKD